MYLVCIVNISRAIIFSMCAVSTIPVFLKFTIAVLSSVLILLQLWAAMIHITKSTNIIPVDIRKNLFMIEIKKLIIKIILNHLGNNIFRNT